MKMETRTGRLDIRRTFTTRVRHFGTLPDLDALAEAQDVQPIDDIDDLVTDFWPENESVEDFIAAATEARHEEDEPDY